MKETKPSKIKVNVHIPAKLKAKFAAEARRLGVTQSCLFESIVRKYS